MSHQLPLTLREELLRVCLKDILFMLNPAEEDTLQRQNILRQLTSIVQSVPSLKSASVNPFGSFASDLYSKWGDLDISVDLSRSRNNSTNQERKRKLLKTIQRALQIKGFGHGYQFIPFAKVPVLMFKGGHPAVSCDISIDNYQGRIKSKFFLWLSKIDGRFRDLVLLIKEWAKTHGINSPKSGTMNSFALCLMLIYHLQNCQPAILPPLREIYDDAGSILVVPEAVIEEKCLEATRRFKTKNRDSLHKLLISFFERFSRIGSWGSKYVICPYSGKVEDVHSKIQWREKSYDLLVEDPFEQTNNAARTVNLRGLISISNAFMYTHETLSSLSAPSDRESLLQCLARREIRRHLDSSSQHNVWSAGMSSNDYSRDLSNYYHGFQSRDHTIVQPQHGGYHFNAGHEYNRYATYPVENRPSSSTMIQPQLGGYHFNSGHEYNGYATLPVRNRPSSSSSSSRTAYWNQRYPDL